MLNLKVAAQYAKFLLKQANESDVLEYIYRDVLFFKRVIEENRHLLKTLQSPIISNQKKMSILNELFKNRVHKLTLNFFRLISHAKNEAILPTIVDLFLKHYYKHKHIKTASITTTFKLSEDLINHFKDLVRSFAPCKEVILTEYINPSIQGGFILRLEDQQIDNSLATKFYKLRKQFSLAEY